MLSGHAVAQEIKHLRKFSSGFIGPQILNFKRSLSLSLGPQRSLVPPCTISLGSPPVCMWRDYNEIMNLELCYYEYQNHLNNQYN